MTLSHSLTGTCDTPWPEHARRLVEHLNSRGLRTAVARDTGLKQQAVTVTAQQMDVEHSVGRTVFLLPAPRQDALHWQWPRPLRHAGTGARWFQPFCPASAPAAAAEKIAAAIHADVRARARLEHASLGMTGSEAAERQILDSVGRPLHTLVYRLLRVLSSTQRTVEDPALLHRLFEMDHLAMRTLRGLERIAVLSGATARQLPEPLPLSTVMRQATAQVEHYSRVRIPPPGIEVDLPSDVAPEITLLLAELVENATWFCPPGSDVQLTAAATEAGARIEITDRGLPMSSEKRDLLNRLLAEPHSVSLRDQIIAGPLGLLVVARLASTHGVKVRLHPHNGGGTCAVVDLPEALLLAPQPPDLVAEHPPASAPAMPPAQVPKTSRAAAGQVAGPNPLIPAGTAPAAANADEPYEHRHPGDSASADVENASAPSAPPPLPRRSRGRHAADAHAARWLEPTAEVPPQAAAARTAEPVADFLQGLQEQSTDSEEDSPPSAD